MDTSINLRQTDALSKPKSKFYKINEFLRSWRQKSQVHHYQSSAIDQDFFLECAVDCTNVFYMTSHKLGVKKGDCIKINNVMRSTVYKILDIDFYIDNPEMWMAKLVTLSDQQSKGNETR